MEPCTFIDYSELFKLSSFYTDKVSKPVVTEALAEEKSEAIVYMAFML
jgi:hypothetical protein